MFSSIQIIWSSLNEEREGGKKKKIHNVIVMEVFALITDEMEAAKE